MKQSDLHFISNAKSCVNCVFADSIEFYWEPRYDRILVIDLKNDVNAYQNIFIPSTLTASDVRKQIISWLEASFGK